MIPRAYLIVHCSLQGLLIAHLAMLIGIARDRIQGISISQLCLSECLELFRVCLQFEFGGEHVFHTRSLADIHRVVKRGILCEEMWQFLPMSEARGLLATTC